MGDRLMRNRLHVPDRFYETTHHTGEGNHYSSCNMRGKGNGEGEGTGCCGFFFHREEGHASGAGEGSSKCCESGRGYGYGVSDTGFCDVGGKGW